ncbi:hypothetical protein RvY_06738 [Ramazzottius varieornatus]|uniref:G-protein coupled receptors family 1 profile domain-containing protein n=1 Tax=Ramazzottius varieornatus TaxID=947166 RepID=A0A1D1V2H4_RAMVA|nr:hypothetical protein RvY_06738 [Ramazzottius varieornatus]
MIRNCVGLSPLLQLNYTKAIVLVLVIPPIAIVLMYPPLYRKYSSLHKVHTELNARYRVRSLSTDPSVQLSGTQRLSRNEHEGFLILTWIVVCVVLFWTPAIVFQILRQILRMPAAQALTEARWVLLWSLLHVCVEPYMFIWTIRPLREKFGNLFRRCGSSGCH